MRSLFDWNTEIVQVHPLYPPSRRSLTTWRPRCPWSWEPLFNLWMRFVCWFVLWNGFCFFSSPWNFSCEPGSWNEKRGCILSPSRHLDASAANHVRKMNVTTMPRIAVMWTLQIVHHPASRHQQSCGMVTNESPAAPRSVASVIEPMILVRYGTFQLSRYNRCSQATRGRSV